VTIKPGDGAVGNLTAKIGKEPDKDGPGSITWTYTVDHKTVPALAEGKSRVETFTLTLDDGHGGTSDQVVTITVRGSKSPQVVADSEPGASAPASSSTAQSNSADSYSLVRPTAYTAHVVNVYQNHV
jgi:VCBS repeat-containing protein